MIWSSTVDASNITHVTLKGMRTTVDIPEPLLHSAKDLAAARSVTLSAVVEDALRGLLSAKSGEAVKPFHLHTVGGKLVEPGTDLDRTSALLLTDDETEFGARR
jgi:hypothetical protein